MKSFYLCLLLIAFLFPSHSPSQSFKKKPVGELLLLLEAFYPSDRWNAVRLLEDHLDNPKVLTALQEFLIREPNPVVRRFVVKALEKSPLTDVEIYQNLITVLLEGTQISARRNAASALGEFEFKAPPVIEALVKVLEETDSTLRQNAIDSLGEIKSNQPIVLEALVKILLEDPEDKIRQSAAIALGHTDSLEAEEILNKTSLEDPSSMVRLSARFALKKINDEW